MTDGMDNNPGETKMLSKNLCDDLIQRDIFFKFSLLGIGEYDSQFIDMIG